ncbi:PREDICTED: uncharacterized protein LOC106809430 [Priapulus caudatus]|uniref:Uncharacterized protein LOC106809430 n=1 Tax=Priapulus caudatus TaxID=37621 RepID=A0ABM1E725_PRICU|nr:PREDICTED: uncharacterized protein LOC106809430 [Priapulus caudatus]
MVDLTTAVGAKPRKANAVVISEEQNLNTSYVQLPHLDVSRPARIVACTIAGLSTIRDVRSELVLSEDNGNAGSSSLVLTERKQQRKCSVTPKNSTPICPAAAFDLVAAPSGLSTIRGSAEFPRIDEDDTITVLVNRKPEPQTVSSFHLCRRHTPVGVSSIKETTQSSELPFIRESRYVITSECISSQNVSASQHLVSINNDDQGGVINETVDGSNGNSTTDQSTHSESKEATLTTADSGVTTDQIKKPVSADKRRCSDRMSQRRKSSFRSKYYFTRDLPGDNANQSTDRPATGRIRRQPMKKGIVWKGVEIPEDFLTTLGYIPCRSVKLRGRHSPPDVLYTTMPLDVLGN